MDKSLYIWICYLVLIIQITTKVLHINIKLKSDSKTKTGVADL